MITCFFAFSVERTLVIIDEAGSAHVTSTVSRMEEKIKKEREMELESHNYIQCLYRELRANLRNRVREGLLHWQALVLRYIQS